MITEDYVSFETAKLLKENGFNEYCKSVYHVGSVCSVASLGYHNNEGYGEVIDEKQNSDFGKYDNAISAPTLQMAMKWLRETHKLCITIIPKVTDDDGSGGCLWEWVVTHLLIKRSVSSELFESYEEACETAIKYCLKLI